jgi:DNA helicase-2/ATP-dependent DNA helicase PcrA
MPEKPYRATRLGTLFHSWVEERYGVGGSTETIDALDTELDEMLETDEPPIEQTELVRLRETFERSEFAALKPAEVEIEIHLVLDDEIVVCKLDAVFLVDGRYRIVDWKTGKAPRDADDLEAKQFQLALYRQAFAEWKGIEPEQIDAVFYYVSDDRVIRPERIYSRDELVALWRGVAAAP